MIFDRTVHDPSGGERRRPAGFQSSGAAAPWEAHRSSRFSRFRAPNFERKTPQDKGAHRGLAGVLRWGRGAKGRGSRRAAACSQLGEIQPCAARACFSQHGWKNNARSEARGFIGREIARNPEVFGIGRFGSGLVASLAVSGSVTARGRGWRRCPTGPTRQR